MNEQAPMMNQQQQQQPPLMNIMNPNLMSMNQMNPHQQLPQMVPMNMNFGMWPPPQQQQFSNPIPNAKLNTGPMNPPPSAYSKPLGPRSNWKGKKVNKVNGNRRKDQQKSLMIGPSAGGGNVVSGGFVNSHFNNYNPPTLNELQQQNRLKTRKFFPKKKFNKNNNGVYMNTNTNMGGNFKNGRSAPFAPRNTSSFLIRAKKSGGITSLVSPCPVTPSVLPTPIFSPSKEVLVDMAKEEWGVDGYGSMKGLIRLRSPAHEMEAHEDEEEDEGGSSESDVEEHVEVERRLDHDLSRFEMIYDPNNIGANGMEYHNVLENRVDDQDSRIAQLEEENLILKERLFLMERELGDLRRRMQSLERRGDRGEEVNEEVNENESGNDSESQGEEAHSMEDNTGDYSEDNVQGDGYGSSKVKGNGGEGFETVTNTEKKFVLDVEEKVDINNNVQGNGGEGFQTVTNTEKKFVLDVEEKVDINNNVLAETDRNCNVTIFEGKGEINNDWLIEANITAKNIAFVEDLDRKNNNENKLDVEAKTVNNNNDVVSSEPLKVKGDVCMNEAGSAIDTIVQEKDVVN